MSAPKTARLLRSARGAAFSALLHMDREEGYSNLVLDTTLRSAALSPRDAALTSALFYGVLEKRLTLDWYLGHFLRDPGKKPDPMAQTALRMGAYQLLFMDRVPDSAAVNETVSLLREAGKQSLCGFVNAVLRALAREKDSLALPEGDSVQALSLRFSVPETLISLWVAAYGRAHTEKLLASFGERAETYIRVNTQKINPEVLMARLREKELGLTLLERPPACGVLELRGSPAGLKEFEEGLFHVQDLSAQLVCGLLRPRPGETVLDCCAAPGGKSFTMAQMMEDRGKVIAFDLYESRAGLIEKGAKRLGLTSVSALQADATKPLPVPGEADAVLCDVPCSGFGVIRRKPEIRYKSLTEVKALPELQYAILKNAAAKLRPGGRLVYSTCTLDPAENGEVAERFLRENPDFSPMPVAIPGVARVLDEPEYQLTMFPFAGASDGFFAAAFQKK